VIDFVGASHWDKSIAALAPDGRTVLLDLGPLLYKCFYI
jgi:NADPH:quinone reductase-like Zn-dependent oxidoreductase